MERRIPVAEPVLGEHELEYVADAIRSGWISSLGPYVTRFEERLSFLCHAQHAVAVCNGTAGLHLALAAVGIGPGDEVIVPAMTFVATANAVRYVGATPIFADCDESHWCIDAEEVARLLTPRTKAVMPVHLFGHAADVEAIRAVCDPHGIPVVEDAAEALGTTVRGRPAGSLGAAGVFSFYGNKLISTGEGGALVTDDAGLAERARALSDHAMDPARRYWHDQIGFNYRITNLQAALGVAQLERVEVLLERKRAIAHRYSEAFAHLPEVEFQVEAPWCQSSWWMTTVLIGERAPVDRDALADRLGKAGIDTRPAFVPLHLLPPYRTGTGETLPVSERIGRAGFTLPSSASLSEHEQARVVESFLEAWRR